MVKQDVAWDSINTALPDQRVRTMKSKEQMAGLDDDSTEIFNSNIIERYSDRPDRVISVILGPHLAHCYTLIIFIIELLSYY